jgi:hypothetical protein
MKITSLKTESKLLGKNVIKISNWKSIHEIIESEHRLISDFDPCYAYCEVNATDLISIHALEEFGYRFSEFRVSGVLRTSESEISTSSFYPYIAEIITEKKHYNRAVEILQESHDDDRFSNDPQIGKDFAKNRVIENLKKSFKSWPNEFLLGIFNSHTNELVAFRTGAFLSRVDAQYYQYAIEKGRNFDHTADMLEVFTIAFLQQRGIENIYSVSTGFNIQELNRLNQNHGFSMVSGKILLRKVFTGEGVLQKQL